MAAMTCAACGTEISDDALLRCACGADLTRSGAIIRADSVRSAAPTAPATACAVEGCPTPPVRAEAYCPVHLAQQEGARTFVLRAPWGTFSIPPESTFGLGRDPQFSPVADYLVEDKVSRQHATLRSAGGRLVLVDVGSRNGTRVNGQRIPRDSEQPLVVGDHFTLGGVVQFRVLA